MICLYLLEQISFLWPDDGPASAWDGHWLPQVIRILDVWTFACRPTTLIIASEDLIPVACLQM